MLRDCGKLDGNGSGAAVQEAHLDASRGDVAGEETSLMKVHGVAHRAAGLAGPQ